MIHPVDDKDQSLIRSDTHDFDLEREQAIAGKARGDLYDRALKLGLLNGDGTLTDKGRKLGQNREL